MGVCVLSRLIIVLIGDCFSSFHFIFRVCLVGLRNYVDNNVPDYRE